MGKVILNVPSHKTILALAIETRYLKLFLFTFLCGFADRLKAEIRRRGGFVLVKRFRLCTIYKIRAYLNEPL